MARIFLSYSREDRGRVQPLAACLERAGHNVWWDQHISGGEQFAEAIEKALHDADVVVAVWSEASARSAWVRDEAAAGRDSGRLVPVTLDGSQPPLGFRQYQTIDLSMGKLNSTLLAPLEKAIAAKAGKGAVAAPMRSARGVSSAPRRGVATAAALVAVVAGGLFMSGMIGGGSDGLSPKVRLGKFEVISSGVPGEVSQAMNQELLAAFGSENLVSVVTGESSAPFVLDGSVRKLDDALRFTVNLKNVESGAVVWTNAYDRLAADTLAPRQVAVAASQVVRCGLWGASSYRRKMRDDGLSLYLQFCADYWGGSANDEQILEAARRVTAAVPDFSFGWSALALAAVPLSQSGKGEAAELRKDALEAVEKSIKLDRLNPEGYMAMAGLLPLHKFAEREDLLKKAIAVRPTECGCERQSYGDFLTSVGRMEEAVEQYERARAMIPRAPFSNVRLAHALHVVGRHDEADRIITEMIEVWPDAATLRLLKVKAAYWTGHYAEAVPLLEAPDLHLTSEQRRLLAATFQALASNNPARRAGVIKELESMARNPRRNDRMIVAALAALGADGAALDASRMLIQDRGHALAAVLFEPNLSDAWASPQYEQLVTRVGLTDYWKSTDNIPDICRQERKPSFCAVA